MCVFYRILELKGIQLPHFSEKQVLNISYTFVTEFGLEGPCPFNYCLLLFSIENLFCLWFVTQMGSSCRWPSNNIWKFNWWCLSVSRSNSLPWCFHIWLSTNMYKRLEHVVQGTSSILSFVIEHAKYIWEYLGRKGDNKDREKEEINENIGSFWWCLFSALLTSKILLQSNF